MSLPLHKFIWLAVVFSTAASTFANPADQFAAANREYAAGNYQAAINGYEALVRSRQWNATLFYNLGNAWFRYGDAGRAVLNYRRALILEPDHPETTANLRLVRDQAAALELARSWRERYLALAGSSVITWTGAVAFWIAVFGLAVIIFSRHRARRAIVVTILACLMCGGAAYALYARENGSHGRALAIVTAKKIEARLATADSASSVLALPAGSEVKLLSRRGDWAYAALPNNLRGWIPTKDVEQVRL
jgi:tetratricopeptide (TPR) repeat protein